MPKPDVPASQLEVPNQLLSRHILGTPKPSIERNLKMEPDYVAFTAITANRLGNGGVRTVA